MFDQRDGQSPPRREPGPDALKTAGNGPISDDRPSGGYGDGSAPPNPGSRAAVDAGCWCPVLDNGHGRGFRGVPGQFVFTMGCPVHCPEPKP
jgi:hypothetical protein